MDERIYNYSASKQLEYKNPINKNDKNKRIRSIDIAKGIGILLVVMGHCIPDATSPGGIQIASYKILHDVIYSFYMPLLFFLAGFMMSREMMWSKYNSKLTMICVRAKRLLVPYVVVGLLYAPFKILLSAYANKPYDINTILLMAEGVNPDGELWLLYSLFAVTVVAIMLDFRISLIGLCFTAIITIMPVMFPIISKWLFFVFLGIYVKRECAGFISKINVKHIIVSMFVFIIGNYFLNVLLIKGVFLLTAVSGIILVLALSNYLSIIDNKYILQLEKWGKYSMDIYILSDIVKIPVRIILWNKLYLYNTAFLVSVIIAMLCSVFISQFFIRRSNLLKRCILGLSK